MFPSSSLPGHGSRAAGDGHAEPRGDRRRGRRGGLSRLAGERRRPALRPHRVANGCRRSSTLLHDRGAALFQQLWDGLSGIEGVKLFGPPPTAPRTPTLAFTVADLPAAEVSRRLADRGIFASHGDFYAMTVAGRLGVARDGLVRIGCACYTTNDEVARVIEGVRAIAKGAEASSS